MRGRSRPGSSKGPVAAVTQPVAFRLLSYNVRSLLAGREPVAAVIRACRPDVACLQESPRTLWWPARCAALADASGLRVLTAGWPTGLAILAGPQVRAVRARSVVLSPVPDRRQRGLTFAVLEITGAQLTVANIHLDLRERWRQRHVAEILCRLDRVRAHHGAPVAVAGDLNETSGDPAWRILDERFGDAHARAPRGGEATFPARRPRVRIDAVFVDGGIEATGCGVPTGPAAEMPLASDHLPVVADLVLTRPPPDR